MLRFVSPQEILRSAAIICKLWLRAADSDELWWDLCDLYEIIPGEEQVSGKTAFKQCGFELNIQELPLVRRTTVVRYSIPDLQETTVALSTTIEVNQFSAYCYLSYTELLVCGGSERRVHNTYHIDLVSGLVTELAHMQQARRSHAAYKFSRSVFVFGGYKERNMDTIERYSIASNTWTLLPCTLQFAMEAFVPARYKLSLYLVGALKIEVFNLRTETLTMFPLSLPQQWYYCLTFITADGEMVIAQRERILSCSVIDPEPRFKTYDIKSLSNGNYFTQGLPVKYNGALYSFQNTHGNVEGILKLEKYKLTKLATFTY